MDGFWFRGAGIGLATKNRRCRSISYLYCFFCPLWLKQNLRTVSRCIATQLCKDLYGGLTVRAAALPHAVGRGTRHYGRRKERRDGDVCVRADEKKVSDAVRFSSPLAKPAA